ncbi:MAG: response regulator transcription factor [Lautropia sp.]
MWRCLIIEDDPVNARYVADGLRELGHTVAICPDALDGLQAAIGQGWDVIVLDRMLPNGIDGLSILASIRGVGRKTPVIVLSALGALDERVRGLQAGSDDYLVKPFAFSELSARIDALIRRSKAGPEPVRLELGDLCIDLVKRRAERGGHAIALQPREFRLLAFLMSNQRRVLTRTMLLESVWDYRFDPQTNVIDVHISRLRQKLDVGSRQPLIHTVRGVGYLMGEAGDVPADGAPGSGPAGSGSPGNGSPGGEAPASDP